MQPGYPNTQPQNPMQPMAPPPAPSQFPSPAYQPPPPAPTYPAAPPQAVMNDIAPPQAYGYASHQPTYPAVQSQPPSNPGLAPNTARFTPVARPMSDFSQPAPVFAQPPQPQNPMQPMAPPPAPSQFPSPAYQPPPPTSRTQVVQNIPVQMHSVPQTAATTPLPYSPPQQRPENPFNYPNNPTPAGEDYHDNRMEDILKDVNRNVSKPEQQHRGSNLTKITDKLKLTKLKSHTKRAVSQPKPAMIIVLAAVTFLSLSMAAFFAFNNDGNAGPTGPEVKVVGTTAAAGDSIQAGGGTLVSSQEVESLSDSLKKQVGGFNDSQDFNQEPLTDQALGL